MASTPRSEFEFSYIDAPPEGAVRKTNHLNPEQSESTNRELLELAAKAAGLKGKYNKEVACMRLLPGERTPYGTTYNYWDPLADNGEALALAVQLRMSVEIARLAVVAWIRPASGAKLIDCTEEIHDDPAVATRRAIVRAAAERAKAMP